MTGVQTCALPIFDKETDDSIVTLESTYPILLTMLSEANTPRYMNVKNIVDGFNKEIIVATNKELNAPLSKIGLKGSPTKVKKTFTKEISKKTEKQVVTPEQAVEIVLNALKPYRKGLQK